MKANYTRFLRYIPGFARLFFGILSVLWLSQSLSAQVLLSGTSFDPIPGKENQTYIGINDVVQYGLQTGNITLGAPLAPNVNPGIFNSTFYYAVTSDPSKLDAVRYKSTSTDYQLVFSPSPTATNLLEYKLTGLTPGSSVQVQVTYCSPVNPSYTACGLGEVLSFRGVVNADQYNVNNGVESPQVKMGACSTFTFTTQSASSSLVDASGNLTVRLNSYVTGSCKAIAITKVEIFGIAKPAIESIQGNEVCAGEQVLLQSKQTYNAGFQWQVNSGTGWANIPNANGKSVLYELTSVQNLQFRLQLTPVGATSIVSDVLAVKSIVCCQKNGANTSRQTIYYDDFGRVDLKDSTGKTYLAWDYSDILNPKEVRKTTTTPFRWTLDPAPLGAIFRGTGPINDGEYTVAGVLTGYIAYNGFAGAMLQWSNAVTGPISIPPVAYDHSGKLEGAALFINCPPNTLGQSMYSRTISNLCVGQQLFFECWIAVFTNAANGPYNGVNVNLRVTDAGNAANVVMVNGTATRQADGGGVWVRLAGQITLSAGSDAVKLDIINNQNVSESGNDLIIDDFKIMACSAPVSELFFNSALAKLDTICDEPLTLNAMPSELLKQFYANQPYYLFQYSSTPAQFDSWKNLGSPQAQEAFSMTNPTSNTAFVGLKAGDKAYFRVVTATSSTFVSQNNFQGSGKAANINDPCRDYSVSTPIEAVLGGSATCSFVTDFENTKMESTALFHPNPTKDLLFLSDDVVSVVVVNTIGKMVMQSNVNPLQLGTLPRGIYQVLATKKDGKTVLQKVVKE